MRIVHRDRIELVHNGTDPAPTSVRDAVRSESPRICVLGRLVPHKRAAPAHLGLDAGGTTESIDHKDSGILVDTPEELTAAIGEVLKAASYSWPASQSRFAELVVAAAESR